MNPSLPPSATNRECTHRCPIGGPEKCASSPARRFLAPLFAVLLLPNLLLAGCERKATKADYVDARIAAECADRTGEAFTLCRLEVIKKYMSVSLEQMQRDFPAPVFEDRMGCS